MYPNLFDISMKINLVKIELLVYPFLCSIVGDFSMIVEKRLDHLEVEYVLNEMER